MRVGGGASVKDLLQRLGVGGPRVAVERNKEIVPRAEYAATRLSEGDVLEVVELVGEVRASTLAAPSSIGYCPRPSGPLAQLVEQETLNL